MVAPRTIGPENPLFYLDGSGLQDLPFERGKASTTGQTGGLPYQYEVISGQASPTEVLRFDQNMIGAHLTANVARLLGYDIPNAPRMLMLRNEAAGLRAILFLGPPDAAQSLALGGQFIVERSDRQISPPLLAGLAQSLGVTEDQLRAVPVLVPEAITDTTDFQLTLPRPHAELSSEQQQWVGTYHHIVRTLTNPDHNVHDRTLATTWLEDSFTRVATGNWGLYEILRIPRNQYALRALLLSSGDSSLLEPHRLDDLFAHLDDPFELRVQQALDRMSGTYPSESLPEMRATLQLALSQRTTEEDLESTGDPDDSLEGLHPEELDAVEGVVSQSIARFVFAAYDLSYRGPATEAAEAWFNTILDLVNTDLRYRQDQYRTFDARALAEGFTDPFLEIEANLLTLEFLSQRFAELQVDTADGSTSSLELDMGPGPINPLSPEAQFANNVRFLITRLHEGENEQFRHMGSDWLISTIRQVSDNPSSPLMDLINRGNNATRLTYLAGLLGPETSRAIRPLLEKIRSQSLPAAEDLSTRTRQSDAPMAPGQVRKDEMVVSGIMRVEGDDETDPPAVMPTRLTSLFTELALPEDVQELIVLHHGENFWNDPTKVFQVSLMLRAIGLAHAAEQLEAMTERKIGPEKRETRAK